MRSFPYPLWMSAGFGNDRSRADPIVLMTPILQDNEIESPIQRLAAREHLDDSI